MKRFAIFLAFGLLLFGGCNKKTDIPSEPPKPKPRKCTVFLAGDSTCAPKSESDRPKYGWGEKFAGFLDGYTVDNRAVGGKSTKTYISGGQWNKLLNLVMVGDVVLIQFGHNDENQTASDDRGTTPEEYYANLCTFIRNVNAKKGVPVILTPICRRSFSGGAPRYTHQNYSEQAKKAASDNDAVLLDIERLTYDWLAALGEEASASRFMVSVDGNDNTHLTEQGATEVAEMVANALKDCGVSALVSLVKQ